MAWLWPNGYPVVRLASGRDLDVIALARDRVYSGQPRLADVYTDAAQPTKITRSSRFAA
jgi:hypothetical protein